MIKFKSGDKVRITRTSFEGICGVITEVFGDDYDPQYKIYVENMNQHTMRYQSELELIDESGNVINTIVESGENNRVYIEDAIDGMQLYVCHDDGDVPHIHYEKTREDGTHVEGCICLKYPLYYKENFHMETLTREEFSALVEYFHDDYVWDHIIQEWNNVNDTKIDESIIPEYYHGMMTTYSGDPMLERCENYYE